MALQAAKSTTAAAGLNLASLADYLQLSKPEVTTLILVATGAGFYAGSAGSLQPALMAHTLVGTLLTAAGTAALNQYLERDVDARMARTRRRPLPAGRMAPARALAFGLLAGTAGVAHLAWFANGLAALLAFLTMASYLLLYTPQKRRSPSCTTLGAVPGAVPPLIGWAAATGRLDPGAWILYAVLFLWQFPHFMAIAWIYREDYQRAGIRMLPVVEPDGRGTARQVLWTAGALIPVSLLPSLMGMAGPLYAVAALLLGVAFLYCAWRMASRRTVAEARHLLHASVIYLPLLYAFLLV